MKSGLPSVATPWKPGFAGFHDAARLNGRPWITE